MNTELIRDALKARLFSGSFPPGMGFAWPNVDYFGARPYLDVSFTGVFRADNGITGAEITEELGQFNAVVVCEHGGGEGDAHNYADMVASLFPHGLSLATADAQIAIIAPAEVRGGFPTEVDYRVPVAVRYHALPLT